jgi:hypothetical protein
MPLPYLCGSAVPIAQRVSDVPDYRSGCSFGQNSKAGRTIEPCATSWELLVGSLQWLGPRYAEFRLCLFRNDWK